MNQIEVCPLCKGRQLVDAVAQGIDPECRMCAGSGYVGDKCKCGKPCIYLVDEWKTYCNTKKCQDREEGVKK